MRRAVVGALAAGAHAFHYLPDTHEIATSALAEFGAELVAKPVDAPRTASSLDTTRAAEAMRTAGCAAVITLGGDGTNRAFVLGWRDAPLLPISTGTNNVFPRVVEATVAGAAAGAVACGLVPLHAVARRAKLISVQIDGEAPDVALIDAVLTSDRFIGSRALTDGERLREALLTRADPAGVGMTSLGGLVHPVTDEDDAALRVAFGDGGVRVRAPIAPGRYQEIAVRSATPVAFDTVIELGGSGVLAFDGERERRLRPGQCARLSVHRDGPFVIDTERVLARAAEAGWFLSKASNERETASSRGGVRRAE